MHGYYYEFFCNCVSQALSLSSLVLIAPQLIKPSRFASLWCIMGFFMIMPCTIKGIQLYLILCHKTLSHSFIKKTISLKKVQDFIHSTLVQSSLSSNVMEKDDSKVSKLMEESEKHIYT